MWGLHPACGKKLQFGSYNSNALFQNTKIRKVLLRARVLFRPEIFLMMFAYL